MKGFTLLEIIIVLAILAIAITIVGFSFSSLRSSQELNNSVEEAVSLLNTARSKTISSEAASQYGVHFETSRMVLFKGGVFSDSDPNNQVFTLSALIEISSISLRNGSVDAVFDRLTGKTDDYGVITFRVKANFGKTKIIEIKSTGIINVS